VAGCDLVTGLFAARTTREYSNVLAAEPLAELLERITGGGGGHLGVNELSQGGVYLLSD